MKRLLILMVVILFPLILSAQTHTATLDSGTTVTSAMNFGRGNYPTAIEVTQGLTDSLKFQVSIDGTNYRYLTNAGAVYYVLVDSSIVSCISLDKTIFFPWGYLKVESYDETVESETIKFSSWRREK